MNKRIRGGSLLLPLGLLAAVLIIGSVAAVSLARYQRQRSEALAFEAKQIVLPEISVSSWTEGDSNSPGWDNTETAFYATITVKDPTVAVNLSAILCGSLGLEAPANVEVILYGPGNSVYYGQAEVIASGSQEQQSFGDGWRWLFYNAPTGGEPVKPAVQAGASQYFTLKVKYLNGFTPDIPVMLRVFADVTAASAH